MRKTILVFALLTAQLGWADEAMDKPYLSTSETIRVTAKVAAVNQETREVTLQLQDGQRVSFVAGEEARNLGQVDVGDTIMAEYVQSMTIEVRAPDGSKPATSRMGGMARSAEGERPGMTMMDGFTESATVEEINIEANTFKLKDSGGVVTEYVAQNPGNLKRASVGDLVVITFTEAVAVVVEEKMDHKDMMDH
jgi:hypothetical protein